MGSACAFNDCGDKTVARRGGPRGPAKADGVSGKSFKLGLPGWIGVGAVGGLATGILVGQPCQVLQPVGTAYVMLLESVVYPYIISSLLHGLGRLSPPVALRLFKKSWPFYLAAWGGTLAVAYLLSLAFPSAPPPSMLDASEPVRSGPDMLQMLLPGNIFRDLANNYVPAVVMLSVIFGVALQGMAGKEKLLDILVLVRGACVKIWNWVVRLAPIAVFAMFASTAGSIKMTEAGGLAVYVGLFLAATGLLAFIAIPAAISALVPIRYRQAMHHLRGGLVLSLVTTLSVVALPFIQQAVEKLAEQEGIDEDDRTEIIETSLAVNYPLGQLGNFFVYFFMLFAAYYYRTPLTGGEQAALPFMTLFSCLGSPTSTVNAVDFLSSWLSLPGRPLDLYIETMIITRYGQVALSVMGFAFLTFLMTFNFYGRITLRLPRLIVYLVLVASVVAALSLASRPLLSNLMDRPVDSYQAMRLSPKTTGQVEARIYLKREDFFRDYPRPDLLPGEPVFHRIQRTHTLRVGYGPGMVPYSYINQHGQLVGYDVACVYDLARSLNVKLVLAPVSFTKVAQEVRAGVFDMFVGGASVTEARMRYGAFSQPYLQSPLSLIVPSANVRLFLNMSDLKDRPGLTVAVLHNPHMQSLARRLFPKAKLRPIYNFDELLADNAWDAALWTFVNASNWTAMHPGYTAIKPKDMGAVLVIAYLFPKNSAQIVQFVNHWMDLRKATGFLGRQRARWFRDTSAGEGR